MYLGQRRVYCIDYNFLFVLSVCSFSFRQDRFIISYCHFTRQQGSDTLTSIYFMITTKYRLVRVLDNQLQQVSIRSVWYILKSRKTFQDQVSSLTIIYLKSFAKNILASISRRFISLDSILHFGFSPVIFFIRCRSFALASKRF